MSTDSSDKVLVMAEGVSPMEHISSLIEQQTIIQLKILSMRDTGCSDIVSNVGVPSCGPANNPIKTVRVDNDDVTGMVSSVINGATKMVAKTIYNFKQKTKEQITDILLHEEQQFLKDNPDYQYDNYRYEDGKHGERTIMLMFKRK